MITVTRGDILEAKGLILHDVSVGGNMSSGLAARIKKKWPKTYEDYVYRIKWAEEQTKRAIEIIDPSARVMLLGSCQCIKVSRDTIIGNCFTQEVYGKVVQSSGYDVIDQCLKEVNEYMERELIKDVNFMKLGCMIGGLEWKVVHALIEHRLTYATNKNLYIP